MDVQAKTIHHKTWNSILTHKISGVEVATVRFFYFRFGGIIQIPGTLDLDISRRGRDVTLRRGESDLATASFSGWKRDTEFSFVDNRYLLQPAPSVSRGAFFVKRGYKGAEVEIGRITRNGYLRWSDDIMLQERVSVEAVSFIYWCALWHYRKYYITICLCVGISAAVVTQLVRILLEITL